jgi:hypothetical protein
MSDPARWRSSIAYNPERIGAAAIYCSDGRYNEQFDEFLHTVLVLPRYDRLVVPGGPAVLAGHIESMREEEALAEQLRFLIDAHELDRVVLIAHASCGYYLKRLHTPPDRLRQSQIDDLSKATFRVLDLSKRVTIECFLAEATEGRVVMHPVPI